MNTDTGEIGEYPRLLAEANDPEDVIPIPSELELEAKKVLQQRKPFVELEGDSSLAQFARDHQRHKNIKKTKARRRRKETKRYKARMRK